MLGVLARCDFEQMHHSVGASVCLQQCLLWCTVVSAGVHTHHELLACQTDTVGIALDEEGGGALRGA